jgi:hypothetical protein
MQGQPQGHTFMTDTSMPDEPFNPSERPVPPGSRAASGLGQSLEGFSIALKALQMVADAGIAAANSVALNATAEEVRQGWLASLMPLRYTLHHLQFRSASLIQAIGDMIEQW